MFNALVFNNRQSDFMNVFAKLLLFLTAGRGLVSGAVSAGFVKLETDLVLDLLLFELFGTAVELALNISGSLFLLLVVGY